jgi:hypothetical protein
MEQDESGWLRRRQRAIDMVSRLNAPTQAEVARRLGVTRQAISQWWKVHQSKNVKRTRPRGGAPRPKSPLLSAPNCGALMEMVAEEVARGARDDRLATLQGQLALLRARIDRTHQRVAPPWHGEELQRLRAMCEDNLRRRWADLDADEQRRRIEAIERLRGPTPDAALVITNWTPVAAPRDRRRARRCSLCGKTDHDRRSCSMLEHAIAEAPKRVPARRSRRCGVCSKMGHDRRECPRIAATASKETSAEAPTAPSSRKKSGSARTTARLLHKDCDALADMIAEEIGRLTDAPEWHVSKLEQHVWALRRVARGDADFPPLTMPDFDLMRGACEENLKRRQAALSVDERRRRYWALMALRQLVLDQSGHIERPQMGSARCHRCGKPGHWWRACPSPAGSPRPRR